MDKNLKKSNTEVGTVDVALRSGSGRYVHSHAYAHGCLRPRMRTCINGEGVEMGRHVTSILCIQSVHACIVTYSHTRMRAYMRTCVYRTAVKMPCHEHVVRRGEDGNPHVVRLSFTYQTPPRMFVEGVAAAEEEGEGEGAEEELNEE